MKESKQIELNKAKWDKWAETFDDKTWRNDYLRKAQTSLISMLKLKADMSILDLGCGTGWALREIAKLVDSKGSFYGVDLSHKMIAKANENFKHNANFHFITSNAESIPLENNLFDIIICTNSFHHYLHPDKAMKEIYRLLKEGGKIYILDPTGDSWLIKLIDKIIILLQPTHVKIYSSKEFEKLIIDSGLKYVSSNKINNHEKIHIGEK